MEEGLEQWNEIKKALRGLVNFPRPKKRQVWWCTVGLNIGSEQSCDEGFERPVLVIKVFGTIFWGIPITSSDPDGKKEVNPLFYKIEGVSYTTADGKNKILEGYIALHQLRAYDARRLKRKILRIDVGLFSKILTELRSLL
ncbi:MAG: type II toxin-antitoxin system PemK/MazF family toxin [Candidatus Paceibacterota bacterium]|jgi:mRNA interferase MazF